MGRDRGALAVLQDTDGFQSTRPVWGATHGGLFFMRRKAISIHAPRMGRDENARAHGWWDEISIHAPRMGRDM